MSAVLQSAFPAMVNIQEWKVFIQDEIEKGIEKALSSKNYVSIEDYNELKASHVDTVELLSIALKRITQLENTLFSTDSEGDLVIGKNDKPILSQNLTTVTEKPREETVRDFYIPHTTLDLKAYAVVEYLKEKVKPRNNEIFMNSREIITFLKTEIPEELRLKDIKNPRQAKKDILEKAVKLFSNSVMIIKNKSGNKVTGIALKPSMKRMDTMNTYGGC